MEFIVRKAESNGPQQHWIDAALMKNDKAIADYFRLYWSALHQCRVEGCEWALVTDGGLKPHRY